MPYNFIIQKKENYIRIEMSGTRIRGKELEDLIPVFSKGVELSRIEGMNRILIISRLIGPVHTMEAFDLIEFAEKSGWGRNFRIANVDMNEESRQSHLFAETVAVNRGYAYKVFDNEEQAIEWLLGK
jgi:hypothetical protein